MPVAGDCQPFTHQASYANLHSLDRRIDISRRSSGAGLFTQDVPRFDCLSQFQLHAVVAHPAINGKTKFGMGSKPCMLHRVSCPLQILDYGLKILLDQGWQEELIVKASSPSDRLSFVGLPPKPGNEGAHKQLLSEAHSRMRRH